MIDKNAAHLSDLSFMVTLDFNLTNTGIQHLVHVWKWRRLVGCVQRRRLVVATTCDPLCGGLALCNRLLARGLGDLCGSGRPCACACTGRFHSVICKCNNPGLGDFFLRITCAFCLLLIFTGHPSLLRTQPGHRLGQQRK